MAEKTCPKCSGEMEEGFMPDITRGAVEVAKWVEGPPQRSFWLGAKVPREKVHTVVTYRCRQCGYLESYAD